MKKIYMYILDTMADHEHGYLLQALGMMSVLKKQKLEFKTVGLRNNPIKTIGGMTLIPDIILNEIDKDDIAAFIMIGADTWLSEEQNEVLDLVYYLNSKNVIIAGICGATIGLAKVGILNNAYHTSNSKFYLKEMCKTYKGENFYRDDIAVCDNNIVTASSAGGLLWTKFIIEKLNIYSSQTVESWFQYFDTGDVKHYMELMTSLL